jgi:prepilin peptidase CpaA
MVASGGLLGLLIGAALFRFACFGGGDAKLIVAIGALLGPVGLWIALFWMALAGGLLALIALARGQKDYAYAPAITAGFAAYLVYPGGLLAW